MDLTKKEGFKLIGVKLAKKTINESGQSGIDCGNLWKKFESENFFGRIPKKLSDKIYAVYFDYDGDYTEAFSYFIGCKSEIDTEVPEGMDSLMIPGNSYYKVTAKGKIPDCISSSWRTIWNSGINRAYGFDFEVYGDRSKDWSNAEVEIFVSAR